LGKVRDVPEELIAPEGDLHAGANESPRQMLSKLIRRRERKVDVSGEMNVCYPNQRCFAPDLFAVLPVMPQGGFLTCKVLGLDLEFEGDRVRFVRAEHPLPDTGGLIAKLGAMVDDLSTRRRAEAERTSDLERRAADLERCLATEAQRATTEAQRASELEKQLGAAREEIERLKRGK
jgi:hypothetical protein